MSVRGIWDKKIRKNNGLRMSLFLEKLQKLSKGLYKISISGEYLARKIPFNYNGFLEI
jgi:hypothetical protein